MQNLFFGSDVIPTSVHDFPSLSLTVAKQGGGSAHDLFASS